MKKLIFLLLTFSIVFVSFAQNKIESTFPICQESTMDRASQATWSQMQMWTATDINGNEHNLADYLAEGKTVIVDFSAVWCNPCWQLHQSGVLDQLHNQYGPEGTDEIVVLWFEVSGAQIGRIEGTPLSPPAGGHTQATWTEGDWTNGGTWPVPIIQASNSLKNYFSEQYEGSVPTMFMICPSGYYKKVNTSYQASYYMNQIGSCPVSGQVPLAEIIGNTTTFIDLPISFQAEVTSVEPITAYEWTFEGGNPATSEEATATVTWSEAGEYQITFQAFNENGPSLLQTKDIIVLDASNVDDKNLTFEEIIVGSTYPSDLAPYNWITIDRDNGAVWGDLSDYGVSGSTKAFVVYSHSITDQNSQFVTPKSGDKCGLAMSNHTSSPANNDWLISPKIQLGNNSSFEAYVKSYNQEWGLEKYKIMVSTTNTEEASFTMIGSVSQAPVNWTKITRDLSEYDGQEVYIAINYVGHDNFIFSVDDIKILTTPVPVGTTEILKLETKVFPNPVNDILNINYVKDAKIQIFNNIGQEIYSISNANEYNQINTSDYEAGSYVIRVTKNNEIENHKMILVK
ncbi:MAG: PKD domain-containing protein [Bacteroidales bacterium]|jgi:hypothetical protein|nr:choice-of-anchor J domain-containing protein [Bacteroidales bacterium]MCK9498029.1 choice-of-anchor J domain-containing protein [Bacteroidales bacterium]NLB86199.1 PKD domain-containing protein [Bacteroidales bacterium]